LKPHLLDQGTQGEDGPGALFLDGIDELDLACQKVLLSMLPDEETGKKRGACLRLISSASRNLEKEIEAGRFRRDLYFRISGVCLRLPPLRERKEDIPVLMEYFLTKHSSEVKRKAPMLGEEQVKLLTFHDWPGNIRELGNLAKKIVALGDADRAIGDLRAARLLTTRVEEGAQTFSLKVAARAASRQAERELILKALDRTHWNRKRAARELQISYKSLLYKIKQAGVEERKLDDR
jgi:two-component system response regulator AtoC